MANAEIVKNLGIELTGDVNKDNQIVNETLCVGSSDKFVKYVSVYRGHKKVTLSPISYELGFCEQVWSQLDLSEKLKLMKWASEDYLQKNGYGTDFPPFIYFTKDNYKDLTFNALAFEKSVLVSLDFINKCSGYDAAILAVHESVHELDFQEINKLLENEISKYVYGYAGIDNFRTIKNIMALPMTGKIINWQTGQYDYLIDDLFEKILLCKNMIMKCVLYKNTPKNRKLVYSSSDFDKYLAADFYYTSPLENKAYNVSIQHIFNMAYDNSKILIQEKSDSEVLTKYYDYLNKINGRKLEIQKHYKMPIKYAVNIELEHMFNKMYYGNKKENYICQEHMQKREEIVKRFWALKHHGKGEYKEGATEQIK